tara:strand:+ start:452 stop:694 length:243 start_codon:yes stop_codon:yes gene_type:complete
MDSVIFVTSCKKKACVVNAFFFLSVNQMIPKREEILRLKALLEQHPGFDETFTYADFQRAVKCSPYIGQILSLQRDIQET